MAGLCTHRVEEERVDVDKLANAETRLNQPADTGSNHRHAEQKGLDAPSAEKKRSRQMRPDAKQLWLAHAWLEVPHYCANTALQRHVKVALHCASLAGTGDCRMLQRAAWPEACTLTHPSGLRLRPHRDNESAWDRSTVETSITNKQLGSADMPRSATMPNASHHIDGASNTCSACKAAAPIRAQSNRSQTTTATDARGRVTNNKPTRLHSTCAGGHKHLRRTDQRRHIDCR